MGNDARSQIGPDAPMALQGVPEEPAAPRVRRPALSVATGTVAVLLFALPHPGAALDHFDCYKIRETSSPRFARRVVTLADQFATTSTDVVRPRRFCNPSEKNGSGIT